MLKGNLAPNGAVIKPSAATAELLAASRPRGGVREHRGAAREDRRPSARHRRKLHHGARRARGRRAIRGFAEVGNMPLPKKVLQKGITDMVRISDGRTSGTAYGAVVLHVSPEAAAGGRSRWCRPAHDRTRCPSAAPAPPKSATRNSSAGALHGRRLSRPKPRLLQALRRARARKRIRARISTSLVGSSGAPVPRDSH